jgi:serine/threonine protein kinase
MALASGQIINNRYRIVKLLAKGGFGTVYRAWDLSVKKPCALKVNIDSSPQAEKQFLREANLLATLRHPNLPRVTDVFTLPSQEQCLVMDFIDGLDLQEMLEQRGTLSETQVKGWLGQVCDALGYLHSQEQPIIHRDIKPANIKITSQGQVFLVDFGISKVYDPNSQTTQGARGVTPGYSPVEQYGFGRTDPRSDLYALGATAYTLLTGQVPPESVQRAASDTLLPASRLNPQLSVGMDAVLGKAMQLDPSRRFQSAAAFKGALLAPGQYRGDPKKKRPVLPRAVWISLALLALLLGLGRAAYGMLKALPTAPPRSSTVQIVPENLTATPMPPAAAVSTAIPSKESQPTETVTFTPTTAWTLTPTITIRPTPYFGPIEFCADLGCAHGPQTVYPQGTDEVFFRFPYANMRPGTSYGRRWYVNSGLYLDYNCAWGEDWPANGTFVKKVYDYDFDLAPGVWRLEIYLYDQLQASAEFSIAGTPRFEPFLDLECNDESPTLP